MYFNIQRPNGKIERMRHIAYHIVQTGPSEWTAYRKDNRKVLGRSYSSPSHLADHCDTCTEPAPDNIAP